MAHLRTDEVEDLLTVFSEMQTNDEIFALLQDLFTIREIKEISHRLAVARYLDQGVPYTRIEATTGASATTIARVSRALNYGTGGYRIALDLLDPKDSE